MACAAVKRSLDWKVLNQRPAKRRRNRFDQSGNSTPVSCSSTGNSPSSNSQTNNDQATPRRFSDATLSRISLDKKTQNIHEEIKILRKGRQLPFFKVPSERMSMSCDSESSGSEMGSNSPSNILSNSEQALFTFNHVQLICDRMLKEREDALREQYDAILTNKLAEQYDSFVKFTYDQIQRRYEAAPSYLS